MMTNSKLSAVQRRPHCIPKNLFALLICLLLGAVQAQAWVANDRFVVEANGNVTTTLTTPGYIYRVIEPSGDNASVAAIGCTLSDTEVTIPATVNDGMGITFKVTQVGHVSTDTGNNKWNATTVKVSEGITALVRYAFMGSTVKNIKLPSTLNDYGDIALDHATGLTTIEFPNGNATFVSDENVLFSSDFKTLYHVPAGKNLTVESKYAKDGIFSVPSSVTTISNGVFGNNGTLKRINIPASVTDIKTGGFPTITNGCSSCSWIEVDANNPNYKSIDGVLFNKAGTTMLFMPHGYRYRTNYEDKGVTDYKVPDGVTELGNLAMYTVTTLTSLDLNQVTKVGNSAIAFCHALTDLTFPDGLPSSLDNMDKELPTASIRDNNALANYHVNSTHPVLSEIEGVVFNKDKTMLVLFPSGRGLNTTGTAADSYIVPDGVTTLRGSAFAGSHVETVAFPSSLVTIQGSCFRNGTINNIVWPSDCKLKTISSSAFESTKFTEITIPASVVEIGSNAFWQCSSLEKVYIADGSQLTKLGKQVFLNCQQLEEVKFLGTGSLTTIGSETFVDLQKLNAVLNIPTSVATIEARAFSGCTNLTTITFAKEGESQLKTINTGAFADLANLMSIELPASVVTIEAEAFRNCSSLPKVDLGPNAQFIDPQAFKFCNNLTHINVVDKTNPYYSSLGGVLLSKDKQTVVIFPTGKADDEYTLLPPSVIAIGDYAFLGNEKLTNVTIPQKVTSIGKRAFGLCPKLTSVTLLCEQVPTFDNGQNTMSFDDGTNGVEKYNKQKITLNVREAIVENYKANTYYKGGSADFAAIHTSFFDTAEGNQDEEYIAVTDKNVMLLSTKAKDYTYSVPTQVTTKVDDVDKTYDVKLIGDYAFQNVNKTQVDVREVVVRDNVTYIGAKAFLTSVKNIETGVGEDASTIRNVFFLANAPTEEKAVKDMLATTRFELDETGDNYNEFAPTTNIYVKKSYCDNYKKAWKKELNNFADQVDYKIKDVDIPSRYGVLAREFDVDLTDCSGEGTDQVLAYIADKLEIIDKPGDWGKNEKSVRMYPLQVGSHAAGTYIPAGTGVLLRNEQEDGKTKDFYYCIGEDDTSSPVENAMQPVITNIKTVNAKAGSLDYFILMKSEGMFRQINPDSEKFRIAVHSAYFTFDKATTSKMSLTFDDGDITSIEAITAADGNDDAKVYYNLQGQRVSNPTRGLYIVGGKKVMVK